MRIAQKEMGLLDFSKKTTCLIVRNRKKKKKIADMWVRSVVRKKKNRIRSQLDQQPNSQNNGNIFSYFL